MTAAPQINVALATSQQLLAFFNEHSATKVKRFADRKTAERRVKDLLSVLWAQHREIDPAAQAATTIARALAAVPARPYGFAQHGQQTCPACGIDLNNGVGVHLDEVNGRSIKHDEFEFTCLGCGAEFGPAISAKRTPAALATGLTRPAMKDSLKLDRTIACLTTGETWKNAYRMWVANPGWMTSAQVDRLTATLYKAAKAGERVSVVINDREFQLVSVAALGS